MSQAREVICLTKDQITTTLTNLCSILELNNLKSIFNGKPSYNKEIEQKYNLKHITKFASNYSVYEARGKDDNKKDYTMYFITLEANNVDKQNILACEWFYHLFSDNISVDGVLLHGRRAPQVYICPAYVISETLLSQFPTDVLPCLYRFATLTDMYPQIGSKNDIYGMVYNYKINNTRSRYMDKDFPSIDDGDVMIKILNAVPGDLIDAERLMNEVSVYRESTTRMVINNEMEINVMPASGLCDGRVK